MPEIRKDPVFGRWVIIASERGRRPNQFRGEPAEDVHQCPFCPGHEAETPPSIYTLPANDKKTPKAEKGAGDWRLRVVMNKYPALTPEGGTAGRMDGMYDNMDGTGVHEVVIETPDHARQMEDMSVPEITDILNTYTRRIKAIKKDKRIKYIMVFKNYGASAGASLAHPHSQIIAMPMAPIRVAQEISGAKDYLSARGACVFCDIIKEESACKKRIVGESGDFIAVAPYASRFSFELWILPKKHSSHFENGPAALIPDLAAVLKGVLGKLKHSLSDLSYNLIIHTMPVQDPQVPYYHWHIEIMPKMSLMAGFEWGTGFYINTVPPEEAAKILNTGKKHRF